MSTLQKTYMQVRLHFSILWITGSSQTTLGINLGLFYIWHRGKKKEKEKMDHHNLDIVQLKERSQVSQRSPASKMLKDQRAGHCSPAEGPAELTPLFGISNPLLYKAPPNARRCSQCHAHILMKATQSTRYQILAQTTDSTDTV